jgi:hypothetical protein
MWRIPSSAAALSKTERSAGNTSPARNSRIAVALFLDVWIDVFFAWRTALWRQQLLAQILRRQDAVGEGDRNIAKVIGHLDLIGFDGFAGQEQRNRFTLVFAGLCRIRGRYRLSPVSRQPDWNDFILAAERTRTRRKHISAAP